MIFKLQIDEINEAVKMYVQAKFKSAVADVEWYDDCNDNVDLDEYTCEVHTPSEKVACSDELDF